MKLTFRPSASLVLSGLLLLIPASTFAQTGSRTSSQAGTQAGSQNKPAEIGPKSVDSRTATQDHWDPNQIVTATVHQAWVLSGKSEANFFEMVEQLADISAKNRGIVLPASEAAGRRMGEYIKHAAAADSDQLLYAIVDKAVLMTAKPAAHAASAASK